MAMKDEAMSERLRLGKNFISQMLTKDGRSPSVDNLIAISKVIGASPLYILTGLKMSGRAERALVQLATAGPEVLDDILELAMRLLDQQQRSNDPAHQKSEPADQR
jgi:transcriptional regulator with XRE-family HTH domain